MHIERTNRMSAKENIPSSMKALLTLLNRYLTAMLVSLNHVKSLSFLNAIVIPFTRLFVLKKTHALIYLSLQPIFFISSANNLILLSSDTRFFQKLCQNTVLKAMQMRKIENKASSTYLLQYNYISHKFVFLTLIFSSMRIRKEVWNLCFYIRYCAKATFCTDSVMNFMSQFWGWEILCTTCILLNQALCSKSLSCQIGGKFISSSFWKSWI